jgi:hypothetical protein
MNAANGMISFVLLKDPRYYRWRDTGDFDISAPYSTVVLELDVQYGIVVRQKAERILVNNSKTLFF